MADVAKTIEIIFSGVDNFSSIASSVGSEIESLGNKVGDIAAPFASVAEAVFKFEAALAAVVAGGLLLAFNASSDLESAVTELKKVMGDNEGTDAAISKAKELSSTYGEATNNIILSTADFKQAGYTTSESLDLVTSSMDLVIAGSIKASEASESIIRSLKGFGEGADQAGRYVDILNEVSNNYATTVEQLSTGMSMLSPIASQMGFSMEESAGLLTPIIEVFGSGEEAANALRTGLLRLTDDSAPVVSALDQLGVSQTTANGQLKSGKEIFYEVAAAMEGMSKEQALFLTQQLVGIEQAPKMSLVFSDMNTVIDVTKTALNAAGSAATEVALRLETSEVAVNRFKAGWTDLAAAIGDEFRDSVTGTITSAADLESALSGIVDSGTFDPIFDYISQFAEDVSGTLSAIAENLPEALDGVDFTSLTDGLDNLKAAISGMFDGIDITTPEGLAKVIQTVVDALGGLQNVAAGIVEFLTPITDATGKMFTAFSNLSPETQNLIGQLAGLGTALSGLAAVLATGGAVMAGIGALGAAVTGPVGLVVGLGALVAAAITAAGALADFASSKINGDLDATTAAMQKQNDTIEDLNEQIVKLPEKYQVEITTAVEKGEFDEAQKLIDAAVLKEHEIKVKAAVEQEEFDTYWAKLVELGNLSETEIKLLVAAEGTEESEAAIQQIIKDREVAVKVAADTKQATETLTYWTEENGTVEIKVPVTTSGADEAKKAIEEIPTEKQIEIKLQGDIDLQLAQIETSAKTVQAAFQYTAEVDIAQIEAEAKVATAAFESVGQSVVGMSDSVSSMFSDLTSAFSNENITQLEKWRLDDIVEEQQDAQNKLIDSQVALNDAQVEYMKLKMEALQGGEALIKIESSGLEPALEMLLWEVLEKVQIKASEEAADFLLGIS